MTEDKGVFEKISNNFYKFTKSEKKITDFVINNQQKLQIMSISELAEACEVGDATISRYCKKLKYSGYGAFKLAIAKANTIKNEGEKLITGKGREKSRPREILATDIDALNQTIELLDMKNMEKAVDILTNAKSVLCMGQGGSVVMANEAAHLFSTAFRGYGAVVDSHLQLIASAHLDKDDAVLFFSYSGSTKEVVEILPEIKKNKAKVILLTRFPKSPAAHYADVILQCGANEMPLQHGSVSARMSLLLLIDILFNSLCDRKKEESEEGKRRVAESLMTKHL